MHAYLLLAIPCNRLWLRVTELSLEQLVITVEPEHII